MSDHDRVEGATQHQDIESLHYKLPCFSCGNKIEVSVDLDHSPQEQIVCPECGDESWFWNDEGGQLQ